ncbi:hypothetical protein IVB55_32835 [Bradyrhizobium sp. CW4]|uniref:hypothetical protein n=1 Tax=Bradyrhizobium sp. CW4 TaxID=2782687 RepID=UPI001FF811A9|nr:hypothetical protein [Bradyrhizobium sp. CW4]MCK1417643.1 hypothetical protein [Bradyrhizobium sp. CW4]
MPASARSRVSNGKSLFADNTVDQRSGWVRRLRDLLELFVSDLGGEDAVSAAERSIVRRAATITVELELLEKRFALSPDGAAAADFDLYLRAANSLRRHLETLGLKRIARDVTPNLETYLRARAETEDD